MSEERNGKVYARPIRAVPPNERRNGVPTANERLHKCPATPEIIAFLRANASSMTAVEMAAPLRISESSVRRICRSLGLKPKHAWTNESPANAADDFKPTPLPPDWTLDAPAGSAERIAKLRERADSGYELWGPNDYARPLPRCEGKIEAPQMENVS